MRNAHSKRAVLTVALSIVAATPALAYPWDWSPYGGPPKPHAAIKHIAAKKKTVHKAEKKPAVDKVTIPPGPLQIVVSIKDQRVTLFADGAEVAHGPVSTGTPVHPTPMGLFTIIEKQRHHVSNLYNAQMPYMQRITWSGSAMHQGPLPGYPASHGCIRLTTDFAIMLWKATKVGARVIVARDEVKPVEIESPQLFVPKPKLSAALQPSHPIRTADAADVVPGVVVTDSTRPGDTPAAPAAAPQPSADQVKADQPVTPTNDAPKPGAPSGDAPKPDAATVAPPAVTTAKPFDAKSLKAELAASARDLKRRSSPVSVFVSRKDHKLYVRQAMRPLFDVPVTIRNPDEPIGTHVYTAMEIKNDGTAMRWTAMSIPSSYPHPHRASRTVKGHKVVKQVEPAVEPAPLPSASAALDRLELTQDIRDDIGALLTPGSSLIISDNSIKSGETGEYTDFIVLTK